jgi:hypothetical protein
MSNRISRQLIGLTAIAVTGLSVTIMPSPATAQEGADRLEEVIVTARKREESLQQVSVAISVVGADLIREAGIYGRFFSSASISHGSTLVPKPKIIDNKANISNFIDQIVRLNNFRLWG